MVLKVSVVGISGKMGKALKALILKDKKLRFVSGVSLENKDFEKACRVADVILDFSSPSSLDDLLTHAMKFKKPLVIGTTGYSKKDLEKIKRASKKIPILYSSNFSLGIAILKRLIKTVNMHFSKSSVDIVEKHHIHKKDKPSGTAKELSFLIKDKKVNISSIRAAEFVGEHSICFNTEEEMITLSHKAHTREVFAKGALLAAKFIQDKAPALYFFENIVEEEDL